MAKTVTGVYDSVNTVRNAFDDLISTGFDREKVFADEDNKEVKVMVPDAAEREATEILNRHQPIDVRSRPASGD